MGVVIRQERETHTHKMWPSFSRPPVASKNGVVPPRSYYGVYNAEVFLGRYNNSFEYNLHEKIVTSSKVEKNV